MEGSGWLALTAGVCGAIGTLLAALGTPFPGGPVSDGTTLGTALGGGASTIIAAFFLSLLLLSRLAMQDLQAYSLLLRSPPELLERVSKQLGRATLAGL